MVRIDGKYEGGLRCRLKHEPSGNEITTDAPKDNMGQGAAFSPTDLLAASLASCMVTTMGIYAERNKIVLEGISFSVLKEMKPQPDRKIKRLPVEINMPNGLSDKEKIVLERAAKTCPVHKSLSPEIETPVQFNYAE